MAGRQTPSQTIGPFFAPAMKPEAYGRPAFVNNVLVDTHTPGERIRLDGSVRDSEDQPVNDALVEIWQADESGRYATGMSHALGAFNGFGRCHTDSNGSYCFETVKPGPVDDRHAPHINVIVFARGMLNHVYSRVFFSDESDRNRNDLLLSAIDPARRDTLIAGKVSEGHYRWDIRLQGNDETVFLDL